MDLINAINDALKSQGRTHADLAERVGMKRPQVTRLLSGKRRGNGTNRSQAEILGAMIRVLGLELTPKESVQE